MNGTLVLFTATFPFRNFTEETFLWPEIDAVSKEFDRVIIVPLERRQERLDLPFDNVEVDTFIADSLFTRFKPTKSPYLLHPTVASHYYHLAKESGSPRGFLGGAFFCLNAKCFGDLIVRWIKAKGLDTKSTLFYTFWFDHITSALALCSSGLDLKIVTRAHGHDVYDSQIPFRSHKFREATIARLAGVYPASDDASEYIRAQYPAFAGKVSTRILGSTKTDDLTTASHHTDDDGVWTFFSCARVEPEKRVDRCFGLVKAIATAYPFRKIKWLHVGDGSLMATLRKSIAETDLPANLEIDLRGAMDNKSVHQIYASEPIDWTMLLSDSEGGCPIALCEAHSYGVPVVATEVGGIPEIITPEVGVTVPPGSAPEAIVGELQPYLNERRFYEDLSKAALQRWNDRFSATGLRRAFAKELSNLLNLQP